jgi:hypothetical protein
MDRLGWANNLPGDLDKEGRDLAIRGMGLVFQPSLREFRISDVSDRAIRRILNVCRREGIDILLVLLPEASEFRDFYRPGAEADVDAYLARLSQEYSLPVVDGRRWCADQDLPDGIHLTPQAAVPFTDRIGREVLRPWVAGWPDRSGTVARIPNRVEDVHLHPAP